MEDQDENDSNLDETEKEIKDSLRYEYYIHYKGLDRRNDRWVTE